MSTFLLNSTSSKKDAQIQQAIGALRTMAALSTYGSLNFKRLESCKSKVLELQLSDSLKSKAKSLFDSAARYMKHEEIGALKFELNLITQLLRRHSDEVSSKAWAQI